jgi:triosephosphate isomerase
VTPQLREIEEVHRAIRAGLIHRLGQAGAVAPILYGGSVTPENAQAILRGRGVGGALVGGASLKAASFLAIIRAAGPAEEFSSPESYALGGGGPRSGGGG